MPRPILDESKIHPAVREKIAVDDGIVAEVQAAVAANPVVVVGMKGNAPSKKARATLTAKGVSFHYLEYGGYLKQWRRRNLLKMWTGWPTFPMIFVKGVFVGGASDVKALVESGELDKMIG